MFDSMEPTISDLSASQIEINQLNLNVAYKKHIPIMSPSDMPFKLLWNQDGIDANWKETLSSKWWASNFKTPELLDPWQLDARKLISKLLQFGGNEVCIPGFEEHLLELMTRGQLWPGTGIKRMPGAQSQCHFNSARLWEANRDNKRLHIATGYALTADDGMWRQHSWCLLEKPRSVQIIETTVPRLAYFGYALTTMEEEEFYELNGY